MSVWSRSNNGLSYQISWVLPERVAPVDHHGVLLRWLLLGSGKWYLPFAAEGDADSPQMKSGTFREEYIAILLRELLRGLEYLHSEGKLHRDIKGEQQ